MSDFMYKGRLDTMTPTEVTYADYLYDLVEPHFAYYDYDVFLSKKDNKLYIEVLDQEAYNYVCEDVANTFAEEQKDIIITLLQPEEK